MMNVFVCHSDLKDYLRISNVLKRNFKDEVSIINPPYNNDRDDGSCLFAYLKLLKSADVIIKSNNYKSSYHSRLELELADYNEMYIVCEEELNSLHTICNNYENACKEIYADLECTMALERFSNLYN